MPQCPSRCSACRSWVRHSTFCRPLTHDLALPVSHAPGIESRCHLLPSNVSSDLWTKSTLMSSTSQESIHINYEVTELETLSESTNVKLYRRFKRKGLEILCLNLRGGKVTLADQRSEHTNTASEQEPDVQTIPEEDKA
jgi:hypothetical protein